MYSSQAVFAVSLAESVKKDDLLDFKPHEKTKPICTILVHQLLSEHRFFAQFVGTEEPPVEELLPAGDKPTVVAYLDKYIGLTRRRLPQLAQGTTRWWLEQRDFFGGLRRERIWVFWRRVLHTCHHRTQVQTWLRLASQHVPAIYGPSGDVTWDDADPTYSVEAARRGGLSSLTIRSISLPPRWNSYGTPQTSALQPFPVTCLLIGPTCGGPTVPDSSKGEAIAR